MIWASCVYLERPCWRVTLIPVQGKVFTARFSPDPETPLTLAAAGSKALVQIWDIASNAGARKAFGDRLRKHGRELGEIKKGGGVVGIVNEEDEDEDE